MRSLRRSFNGSILLATLALASSLFEGACSSGRSTSGGGGAGAAAGASGMAGAPESNGGAGGAGGAFTAFEPVAPAVYVAKVKNVLVGLPPTADEIAQVTADPATLKTLIATWMQLPGYNDKLLRFFELAFQQTQITADDFADQTYPSRVGINPITIPLLAQNAKESFARTMLALVSSGAPLTAGLTTNQLMMTTALKELYAFLDVWQVDDDGKVSDRFKMANPGLSLVIETAGGPIPLEQTLDPAGPNYMHWYNPDAATAGRGVADCAVDPLTLPANARFLHYLLYGSIDNHKAPSGTACQATAGNAASSQLATTDFTDWQLVTIRTPKSGEASTPFYDILKLRQANELVLKLPRVGFFSTPAFFANWPTNISNQMRVTVNQALIVGLGQDVHGQDAALAFTAPPVSAEDQAHAGSADCAFCHRTLDPLRSIFAATYTWNYHEQTDAARTSQPGLFAYDGVVKPAASLADFGAAMAAHPDFAMAWAQKLCFWASSSACDPADPELQRVVTAFAASGYAWPTLVTELLSSPVITNAAPTVTNKTKGEVITIARRDHLCAALDARLGTKDVCAIQAVTKAAMQTTIAQIGAGLPSDGYGRGATAPVLPNQSTLFYRAATENICTALGAQVIDVATAKRVAGVVAWTSTAPDAAIADFVGVVMGLGPGDARVAPATAALQRHYQAAVTAGAKASDALKSTFITACLAPSAVAVGL